MLSLLILLLALWHFYIGYNRGIILQGFYTVVMVLGLFIAKQHYQTLADKIGLWIPYSNPTEGVTMNFFTSYNVFDLDKAYYAGVAFVAIFALVYLIGRFLGILVHLFPLNKLDSSVLNIISGVLAVLVLMAFLSMTLTTLATVPMATIQNHLAASSLVKFLINHFPPFSILWTSLWMAGL